MATNLICITMCRKQTTNTAQVQNAVDVKRIVTRLALFQFSEGQSRSSNGSHKAINYSGTPLT